MIEDKHVIDLLPAYALGSLEEDEADQVSEHLTGCSLCQSEFAAYQSVANQLALAGVESDPPPDLKNQLFNQLGIPQFTTTHEASSDGWGTAHLIGMELREPFINRGTCGGQYLHVAAHH